MTQFPEGQYTYYPDLEILLYLSNETAELYTECKPFNGGYTQFRQNSHHFRSKIFFGITNIIDLKSDEFKFIISSKVEKIDINEEHFNLEATLDLGFNMNLKSDESKKIEYKFYGWDFPKNIHPESIKKFMDSTQTFSDYCVQHLFDDFSNE